MGEQSDYYGWYRKYTPRHIHSKNIQNKTEQKYGTENLYTVGHSQGGFHAENLGVKSKKVITYNKPVLPNDVFKKGKSNQIDIRTENDPVSILSKFQFRNKNIHTIPSTSKNLLQEHSTDALNRIPSYLHWS
jgi:hypothetical protein